MEDRAVNTVSASITGGREDVESVLPESDWGEVEGKLVGNSANWKCGPGVAESKAGRTEGCNDKSAWIKDRVSAW